MWILLLVVFLTVPCFIHPGKVFFSFFILHDCIDKLTTLLSNSLNPRRRNFLYISYFQTRRCLHVLACHSVCSSFALTAYVVFFCCSPGLLLHVLSRNFCIFSSFLSFSGVKLFLHGPWLLGVCECVCVRVGVGWGEVHGGCVLGVGGRGGIISFRGCNTV